MRPFTGNKTSANDPRLTQTKEIKSYNLRPHSLPLLVPLAAASGDLSLLATAKTRDWQASEGAAGMGN